MKASDLFSLPESLSSFQRWFRDDDPPWTWVSNIGAALEAFDFDQHPTPEPAHPGLKMEGPIYIHPSVSLPPFGVIIGPAYIGPDCELRPGVLIRGNVIAGSSCVLGNSCEFKNSLLLDRVMVPHFSYVGDSVLGSQAHLGAGAILSNLRFDAGEVAAATPSGKVATGLRKLGGLLGDGAEMGCNSVLQPGSVLGRRAIVVTGLTFNGYLEPDTLAYLRMSVLRVRRRDL